MTRVGIITAYPEEDWHSARLLAACVRARVAAVVLDPSEFSIDCGAADGRVQVRAGGEDIDHFDAFLLPRAIGEDGDPDVQLELYRSMEREGALLVNRIEPLLSAIDKLRTSYLLTRTGVPTPRVIVVQRLDQAEAALAEIEDAVVKPIYGSLGIDIVRIRAGQAGAREILRRMLRDYGAAYLQRFATGPLGARDIRAFVVGGRVEAAIYRIAREGEFRTNIHQGAAAQPCQLSPQLESLAVHAAAVLGLEYAGVDIVEGTEGPVVLEVNGTPHWEGILHATGHDMAHAIVARASRLVEERASRLQTASTWDAAEANIES